MTQEIPKPELQELVDLSDTIYQEPITEIRKLAEEVERKTNELQAEIYSLKAEIELLRGPPTKEITHDI